MAEAAGLVLAVLPILIHAAEHYNEVFRPFQRYKNCAKEVKQFHQLFTIQKDIFRNQCRLLLAAVTEYEVASSMLNGLDHPLWSDQKLDDQLLQLLGESQDSSITTIQLIQDELRSVENECQATWFEIDEIDPKPSDSKLTKAWRARVAKKFRFSISKPRLDQNLLNLRSLNQDFRTLSNQVIKVASSRSKAFAISYKSSHHEIQLYNAVREASQQIYKALGHACIKHTEHQARFCVEVEQADFKDTQSSQIKFSMAFTHLTLANSTESCEMVWFVVDSITSSLPLEGTTEEEPVFDSISQSLKRELDDGTALPLKKVKKSVRFQTSVPIPAAVPAIMPLFDRGMRKDFCDILRHCSSQLPQPSRCLCVLEDSGKMKNHVYPAEASRRAQQHGVVSLRQLISSMSKEGTTRRVPIYEKMRLAKTLAVAVLRYYATPWLRQPWRSEDVLFFGNSAMDSLCDSPTFTKPHLNVRVKGPGGQLSRVSTFQPHSYVRNPWLYSLGIVLLEIAYSAALESFKHQKDLDNGQENQHTEYFVAHRVAKSGFTDMGGRYHRIIEKLIDCDFGCGSDFSDVRLQSAFHSQVICPLEQLESDLRKFHFDTEAS